MMGRQEIQEQLFYQFRIEDHVPADHLLRRIDRLLDLDGLRPELAALYSRIGRPSIDPELMIRMLLVGYLYGIRSERRLVEEVHLNLAYRWFCRLGLEGRVPDRSTFSKNRHGRFAKGDVMRRVFEAVVAACAQRGLIGGQDAAVDGSTIQADANKHRKAAPGAIQDIWAEQETVARPVRAYLDQLEEAAAADAPAGKPPKYISQTDPQAAWSLKDGPGRFSYETNYLIDTDHGVIVDVEATPARLSQEIVAAKTMLKRAADRHGYRPDRLAADKAYGTGAFLSWLFGREVDPHVPVLDRTRQTGGKLDQSHFAYDPEADVYRCPGGHDLTRRAENEKTRIVYYRAAAASCGGCALREACTSSNVRTLTRHMDEWARERVRGFTGSPGFEESRRRRKKVEMLFAHLKRHLNVTRLRLRGLTGAAEEFLLAAAAQNLRRMARLTA